MSDTSELYRTMCDTPEIQKDHEWQEGDWLFADCKYWCIGDAELGSKISENIPIPALYDPSPCGWHDDKSPIFLPDIGWYLEQVTQCLGIPTVQLLFEHFNDWNTFVYDKDCATDTMEQLCLAFYMFTNHGKTWNEVRKEWVKK